MRLQSVLTELARFRAGQLRELAGLVEGGLVVPRLMDVDEGGGKMVVELMAAGGEEVEVRLQEVVEKVEGVTRLEVQAWKLDEALAKLLGGEG